MLCNYKYDPCHSVVIDSDVWSSDELPILLFVVCLSPATKNIGVTSKNQAHFKWICWVCNADISVGPTRFNCNCNAKTFGRRVPAGGVSNSAHNQLSDIHQGVRSLISIITRGWISLRDRLISSLSEARRKRSVGQFLKTAQFKALDGSAFRGIGE